MKPNSFSSAGSILLAFSLISSGCVVHEHHHPPSREPVVYVTEPPPQVRVETVTVAPSRSYVWVPGGWVWRNRWVWEEGHWAQPPHAGAVWVPHRYTYQDGRHVWIQGGWR